MNPDKDLRTAFWKNKICNTEDKMFLFDGYDRLGRGIDGKKKPFGALNINQHNKYIRKNMYGNCRCKDKNGHSCGWVTLLDSGIDNSIISRNWPIDYGVYNILTHKLLQKYILPDYTYDLSKFESESSLIDLQDYKSELNISSQITENNIPNYIDKLINYENYLKVKEKSLNELYLKVCCHELKQIANFKIASKQESEL